MNPLPVPYFKQDTWHTCGPVAVQMVLKYFGITKSETDLAKELDTTTDGTEHSKIIEGITNHGLYCYANNGSSIEEVLYLLSQKIPVVVNYIEPDDNEGHYAVAVAIRDNEIVLNDPLHGEGFSLSVREFEKRWKSENGNFKRWMCAVSDKSFVLGRSYNPTKPKFNFFRNLIKYKHDNKKTIQKQG